MNELKPCPFCGGEAIPCSTGNHFATEKFFVSCGVCGVETPRIARTRKEAIAAWNSCTQPEITGNTSDGYHTFNELYHHRAMLFSVICNDRLDRAWKSKMHHDGTMYDGMFIVGIQTPNGQATYHYDIDPYWDMFRVPELPQAPEWDGHTPAQAIERIGRLAQPENKPLTLDEMNALNHEPIYILHMDGHGKWSMNGWHIATASSYRNHGRCDLEIDNGNTIIDMQNYGKTWLAYRSKPGEDTNER